MRLSDIFSKGDNMTRCKFVCNSVTKTKHWNQPVAANAVRFLYTAKFSAVYNNSPENQQFFDATPTAELSLGVYKEDLFEPGQEYYLDFSETK